MILCWLKWPNFFRWQVSFRGCACEPNKSQAFMYRICTGIVHQPHGCCGYYCESLGVQTVRVFFSNFSRLDPDAARDRGFNQVVNIHHSRYIFQCLLICICLYDMCLFQKNISKYTSKKLFLPTFLSIFTFKTHIWIIWTCPWDPIAQSPPENGNGTHILCISEVIKHPNRCLRIWRLMPRA